MGSKLESPFKGIRLIWRIIFILNILFILFLLFAYLSVYVNPSSFYYFALFGLLFPITLTVNFVFIILWLFIKKQNALYSGVAIVLGVFYLADFFAFNFIQSDPPKEAFKVMSYNVRLFDLYNWKGNRETKQKIFNFLERENPAIICFQEFYERHDEDYEFKTTETLVEILDADQHFEKYTHKMYGKEFFGVATYTKYPIVSKGIVKFESEETNACIFTDLKIGTDTLRVYNTHMGSIRFNAADYKVLGDPDTRFKANRAGSSQIIERMRVAYKKRVDQASRIIAHSLTSPYPVLICGDFNDIPISYTYHQFERHYLDAFLESGFGIGKTYIGQIPSYRIDYIWHSPEIESYKFKIHQEELSDHRAISCYIKL